MIAGIDETRAKVFGAALAFSTLVGALVAGFWVGLEIALLVVAAGALVLVIALLWASVAGLSGGTALTLDEALGMGAPSAEEEQKRAVLRALKDLEYERSVGKISEDDYREFSERYRADARRLIAAVDATLGPSHALAEKLATERLAAEGLVGDDVAAAGERDQKPPVGSAEVNDGGSRDPVARESNGEADAEASRPEPAVAPARQETDP